MHLKLTRELSAIHAKRLLLVCMVVIAAIFGGSSVLVYRHVVQDVRRNEQVTQQKISRIVDQSLNRYFETLRFTVENAVLSSAFRPEVTVDQDRLRYRRIPMERAKHLASDAGVTHLLGSPRKGQTVSEAKGSDVAFWQIFKALPDRDESGSAVAVERRTIARNILKSFRDIHYVFEMDSNGDLVFLEPFDIQKNITSFNFEFRDYLQMVKTLRGTAISEGYISHDQNRTQIITVATPVFDKTNRLVRVFAASVSAATLRESVFRSLKRQMDVVDGTTFYLVDRHGHIVASSSGKNIYFPKEGAIDDEGDFGNLRRIGFFQSFGWIPDTLEKGNVWERKTQSWIVSSLAGESFGQYRNTNGVEVYGTFVPTSFLESSFVNWGILIETPLNSYVASQTYLRGILALSGIALGLALLTLFFLVFRHFGRLESQILRKETELRTQAEQVAHDLRSPIAAFEIALSVLPATVSEEIRGLMRGAVVRMWDVAQKLLRERPMSGPSASSDEVSSPVLVAVPVEAVVTEKRSQCGRVNLLYETDPEARGIFVNAPKGAIERSISNCIDNALDAVRTTQGSVTVRLSKNDDRAVILISDDGVGIPPEVLPHVGKRGFSHGKQNGHGLGVYAAIDEIGRMGGTFEISSQSGKGTVVTISLPCVEPRESFRQPCGDQPPAPIPFG